MYGFCDFRESKFSICIFNTEKLQTSIRSNYFNFYSYNFFLRTLLFTNLDTPSTTTSSERCQMSLGKDGMKILRTLLTCKVMLINCFCGMVYPRKTFSHISRSNHCQRFSPLQISDPPRAEFELAQNLSSGFSELNCAVVITNISRSTVDYWQIIAFFLKSLVLSFRKQHSSKNLVALRLIKIPYSFMNFINSL